MAVRTHQRAWLTEETRLARFIQGSKSWSTPSSSSSGFAAASLIRTAKIVTASPAWINKITISVQPVTDAILPRVRR